MPRDRDPLREEAKRIWVEHEGKKRPTQIARMLGCSPGSVRGWKSKDNWPSFGTERSAKRTERSKPQTLDEKLIEIVEGSEDLTERRKLFCLFWMHNHNATQAYLKAFPGVTWTTANVNGSRLMADPRVKKIIGEMKKAKYAALEELCGEDIVELHMRIAFADITDFVEFGSEKRYYTEGGKPILVDAKDEGGKSVKKALVYKANVVRFKDSSMVDGNIITEVSQGKDGAKIKLADRQRSLQFLERYFELNPTDSHRMEYDHLRYELEKQKANQDTGDDDIVNDWVDATMGVDGDDDEDDEE